jgi:hypothetical protein
LSESQERARWRTRLPRTQWQTYRVAGVPEVVLLKVRGGEIVDSGSWVYAWCRKAGNGGVVYVGATGLDPATRAWLHLHDPNPAVGRVLALLPTAGVDSFDVVALRLPSELSRPDVKAAVITRLSQRGLLAADYVGDPPLASLADATPEVIEHAERLTDEVAEHAASTAA